MTQKVNVLSRPAGLSPGISMEKEGTDSHKLSSGLYVMLCTLTLHAHAHRHTHHTHTNKDLPKMKPVNGPTWMGMNS